MFSSPKQLCKRLLSVLLALTFVASPIAVIAEDAIALADAADSSKPLAVVYAGSDFQPRKIDSIDQNTGLVTYGSNSIKDGVTQLTDIVKAIKKDYNGDKAVTGALFGGDYANYSKYKDANPYGNNLIITQDGTAAVESVLGSQFGLSREDTVMIQGNHDFFISPLDETGPHDTEEYGVYAINEKDFMYQQGTLANGEDTVKKTAADLEVYLNAKVDQQYNKPIFIINHVPLHHSSRSEDNRYAYYLFDVINKAGSHGLTIFYLFGHNHGNSYDAHLGEGSIYLKPGEIIYVPNGSTTVKDSKTIYGATEKTLNFVYMNAGYTGYIGTAAEGFADNTLTSTVFAIYDDRVEVKRYDANGLHNLKSEGKYLSTYEMHDLHIYPQVVGKNGDVVRLDNKFNISLNIDYLYPRSNVTSTRVKSATIAADANTATRKVNETTESVTLADRPVAQNFKVGSTGTIGIDCILEQFTIKSVTSSDESVATVKLSNGKVSVTGVKAGKTTLTVTSSHDGNYYDDVVLTYDLVVFPDTTTPLKYTRYELINAYDVKKNNTSVPNSTYTTVNGGSGANSPAYSFVAGESYVFVNGYQNDNGWAYAMLNAKTSPTLRTRNVALYGTYSTSTFNGTYIDSCDEYMEWVYCSGGYLRNAATGLYLTSNINTETGNFSLVNECPKDADGNGNTNNDFNTWKIGGFGIFIDDAITQKNDATYGDLNVSTRRYIRYDSALGNFVTELASNDYRTTAEGRGQQYSNVMMYKKVTTDANGLRAWVDTTNIYAFEDSLTGKTNATMYVSSGMNVTAVPVTMNMLTSATTYVSNLTEPGVIASNYKVIYDDVAVATGVTLTVKEKPQWTTTDSNKTIRVGEQVSIGSEVTVSGATVTYSYESLDRLYATVDSAGTVKGVGVGGASIRVTATATYSDGAVLTTTDDVYVTVRPANTCAQIIRAFGKNTVYSLVDSFKAAKYNEDPSVAEEVLIVSSDDPGDAYAMQYYEGRNNHIKAFPVNVESYNGVSFIQLDDQQSLLWRLTQESNFSKESKVCNGTYSNLSGIRLPNASYYQLDSALSGLRFITAITSLQHKAFAGLWPLDNDTSLYCTVGGASRIHDSILKSYPNTNGEGVTYTNPAAAWNYSQSNVGFAAINYNPYYYASLPTTHENYSPVIDEAINRFTTDGARYFTYVLTYNDANETFMTEFHDGVWPSGLNSTEYEGRVFAYAKRSIQTSGVIIWISDKNEGTVGYNATADTATGAMINITTHSPDSVSTVSYPITYGMLSSDEELDTTAAAEYDNVTVKYTHNGKEYTICQSFTLKVADTTDNYPDYPEQGSVNVTKSSDTSKYDYFGTGTSHIDLTVSGIPLSNGTDIVITLDFSTSMDEVVSHASGCNGTNCTTKCKTRVELLGEVLVEFLESLRAPDTNGKIPDVDVAIASFNGQTYMDTSHILSPLQSVHTNWNDGYSYYNEADQSKVRLQFVDVSDDSVADFIANVKADIVKMTPLNAQEYENFSVLRINRGTNYDRAMDITYDLLTQKKAINAARGEKRNQAVLFMSDGASFQYNYFGARWSNSGQSSNATIQTVNNGWVHHDKNGKAKWSYVLDGTLDDVTTGTFSNKNTLWHENFSTHKTADKKDPNGIVLTDDLFELFKEYYNPAGRHWMAEAIKGDPLKTYKIIDPDSNATNHIEYVNGLGATMYTVTVGIEYDKGMTAEVLNGVVERMASVDPILDANGDLQYDKDGYLIGTPYFYSATDAAAADTLKEAFSALSSQIQSSGDAVFSDKMGADFDLQMDSSYTVNNKPYNITPPSITITSYPLYKYWEVGTNINGVIVTEDMVGKRKSDVGTVIEEITFAGTANDRQAYSNLIGEGKTNILKNGIIQGKNVWYNTYTTSVMLNGETYEPETFYWMIGNVPEDEYVLGYDIYLSGSMEGTAFGGIHYTNEYARLDYINHLGNKCFKTVESPTLPWKEAYIGVNFYFVNKEGMPLVNRKTGQTGSFDMAQTLGKEKTQYVKFALNDSESVSAIAKAEQYVPAGYTLYDSAAEYNVFASSSPSIPQRWEIKKGAYMDVSSTYVTQFSSNVKSSNALTETNSDYSYTNTIVYFAIVATVDCVPDAVVIDYGLPVDIDVMENDILFTDNATLTAVGATDKVPENPEDTEEYRKDYDKNDFTTSYEGSYGNASVINETDVRYKLKSMLMDGVETFTYVANYTGDLGVNGYYYGNVTVIPATSIYYEDSDKDFVKLSAFEYKKPNSEVADGWVTVGATSDASQNDDRIGDVAANIYGSDEAYSNCTTYSYGSAQKITVKRDSGSDPGLYGKAEFTFEGTGFDVISLTSSDTGTIVVQVKDSNGKQVRSSIVDTYYGYKYEDSKWTESYTSDVLYQVPVIKMTGLDYGEYSVTVSVSYAPIFAHNDDKEEYDFYLDAIRIYDPAKGNDTVQQSYAKDLEAFPKYDEIRNLLIAAKDFNSNVANSEVSGAIFIDGIRSLTDSTASGIKLNKLLPLEFGWSVPELLYPDLEDASDHVSDYAHYGPNNELYLDANQAVAFDFTAPVELQKVHLAVKALKGGVTAGTLEVYGYDANNKMTDRVVISTKSATDTYTDITKIISMDEDVASMTTIVIKNTGSSLISITNLKTTYSSEVSTASATVNQATANRAFEVLQMIETPEIYTMHTSKKVAEAGESVNVVLTTSANADYVTVNGVKVTAYTENSAGSRIWSVDVVASGDANMVIEALAYNVTGTASEAVSADVRIKAVENVEIVTVLGAYIDEAISGK